MCKTCRTALNLRVPYALLAASIVLMTSPLVLLHQSACHAELSRQHVQGLCSLMHAIWQTCNSSVTMQAEVQICFHCICITQGLTCAALTLCLPCEQLCLRSQQSSQAPGCQQTQVCRPLCDCCLAYDLRLFAQVGDECCCQHAVDRQLLQYLSEIRNLQNKHKAYMSGLVKHRLQCTKEVAGYVQLPA